MADEVRGRAGRPDDGPADHTGRHGLAHLRL